MCVSVSERFYVLYICGCVWRCSVEVCLCTACVHATQPAVCVCVFASLAEQRLGPCAQTTPLIMSSNQLVVALPRCAPLLLVMRVSPV